MIKTMIVEDDPMVRQINSKFLNKVEGFSLEIAAANLTEAKEFVSNNAVRKYLDYMSKKGELEKIIEYGKIGRPLYKYKIKNL